MLLLSTLGSCSTTRAAISEPQVPLPRGLVSDFADKLSAATKRQIETLLSNFRNRTGIEVGVVTIPFDDMQGYPIEEYALQLGRQWGLGRDSEKRALLLLVAIKPADAEGYHGGTRLEVSRHLEGDVPDILAGELIRKMRVDFIAGRFDQALTTGTQTILATLAEQLGISMEGIDRSQAARVVARRTGSSGRSISHFLMFVGIFIFLAILRAIGRGGGRRPGSRRGLGADWIVPIIIGTLGDRRERRRDRDDSHGWGGFGGGDSGGGGFGGFGGGGDFGGGGASDSW